MKTLIFCTVPIQHTILLLGISFFCINTAKSQIPPNDDCANAIPLPVSPAGTGFSTTTTGFVHNATVSGVPASCGSAGNLYDVWYSFTATGTSHNIRLNNGGSNYSSRQIIIYRGTCGNLSLVKCSPVIGAIPLTVDFTDYSHGATYYVRVIYLSAGAVITSNGGFRLGVSTESTGSISANPPVQAGKSYKNISKPGGGSVENGDILEMRSTIAVGQQGAGGGNIYNATYHDTIPAGFSYIANSIRFQTNESLVFESGITGTVNLTDASGDDEAVYDNGIMRVHTGSLPRVNFGSANERQEVTHISPAATPITYASAGGGKVSTRGKPNQFNIYCIIVVTYRVQVTALTGTNVFTSNGAFRYKFNTSSTDDVLNPQTIVNLQRFNIHISDGVSSLCSNTPGINVYANGNFGSGATRHDSTQLTSVPGYTWQPFGGGTGPNDGRFAIANNTSTDLTTNKYAPLPSTSRVFGDWDIIGDHTNAVNQDSGNFATPYGTTGGYMAVVNAAYATNNAVQRSFTSLCPDTYYEFSAWFKNICAACSSDSAGRAYNTSSAFKSYIPVLTLNDSAGVNPDVTFTIDGVDYYSTGDLLYDRRWVKKGFLFITGPSQSNVTLTIRNNAAGGGGNDWAMDDISFSTCLPALQMRPGNTPTYCLNGQINLSAIVNTVYNNYSLYQWERSTDGGATWSAIGTPQNYSYTPSGSSYIDTVALPTIIATAAMNGHQYRIRTATSLTNLSTNNCAVYNGNVFTITVNPGCSVLPAELLSFHAQLKNGYTELKWTSKQEQTLQQYEVERSSNGKDFVKIGTVAARGSITEESYHFIDSEPVSGKVYYRIQLKATGNVTYKYSHILAVTVGAENVFELANLVNPVDTKVSFQLTIPQNETVELQLADAAGKIVYRNKLNAVKGTHAIGFEIPAHLQRGHYVLRVSSPSGTVNKTIQKQ